MGGLLLLLHCFNPVFMSVWTHVYVHYIVGYTLFYCEYCCRFGYQQLFQMASVPFGILPSLCFVPPPHNVVIFQAQDTPRSHCVLILLAQALGVNRFSKEPQFLLLENGVRKQDLCYSVQWLPWSGCFQVLLAD